jgi:signal transduction histidine kinase
MTVQGHPEKHFAEKDTQCEYNFEYEKHKEELIKIKDFIMNSNFISKLNNMLQNIEYSSKMQINLVNDMMDLAKMKENKFEFNEKYFNLLELVDNALS